MGLNTIFFDLDDTLYPSTCGLWPLIGQRIELYMHEKLDLDWEKIPGVRQHLYETYGTTLRGLQLTHQIDTVDYLAFVHDVPVEDHLEPAPRLRETLLRIPYRRLILTNADTNHACRVINQLGLQDCFEQIIDIHQLAPSCKPQPEAFTKALALAGEPDAGACMFIDDSLRNLRTAAELGFHTVYIGSQSAAPAAHHRCIRSLEELPEILADFQTDGGLAGHA